MDDNACPNRNPPSPMKLDIQLQKADRQRKEDAKPLMCFSATASFIAASATGLVGIATLSRISSPRDIPLAAIPLVFALQQAIEGILWLTLPVAPNSPVATLFTTLFLTVAHILWPILVPLAALLVEPKGWRRNLMRVCMALGIAVAAYMAWVISTSTHGASIEGGHIYYAMIYPYYDLVGLSYLLATAIALLLSTHRIIAATGALILVGYIVSWFFYWNVFVSVWCFFAALASIMLLFHFIQARRKSLQTAS